MYTRSVSFSGNFSSGSRVSASRSDLLKVRIMKIVVRNLQIGDCWVNNQEHLFLKKTTCAVVFNERKVNDEITDQTRKSTIERRWVVTEIYLTATVNAITLWIDIKYHIWFPLPSCVLDFCSIFVLPRTCFDGTNPRNDLVHQRDASVWQCCCAQAQCGTNIGETNEIRNKKT